MSPSNTQVPVAGADDALRTREQTAGGFAVVDPTTGQPLETYPNDAPEAVERAVAEAHAAVGKTPMEERCRVLRGVAKLLREGAPALARDMAIEMGKPLAQGEAEAKKCADTCDHYAEHAPALFADDPRPSDASKSYVRRDPLGVVLAIMPWNFPLWQVFRAAAPALAAGNAMLLKHAPNVPRAARACERMLREAGAGASFRSLFIGHDAAMDLLDDDRVAAVTLTGSERAGAAVAARAGRALKPSVLELGGSDPFLILDDADVAAAAKTAADARLLNSGQSCIAAKRFIATPRAYDAFVEALVAELARRRVGDPQDRATDVGPVARADLRGALTRQVAASVAAGARVALGGAAIDRPGFFFAPTVLVDVAPGAAAFDEETFGPVAAVVRAADEEDALRLANASRFGLGASVWTSDAARAEALAARLEVGAVFVNGLVKSDPRLPFGGVKRSGYGRELGAEGAHAFVNVKTVWIR